MNIPRSLVLSAFICFLFPALLRADLIVFKSGNAVPGKVVKKTDQFVEFNCYNTGVVLTFSRDEIGDVRETPETATSLTPGEQSTFQNEDLKKALGRLLDVDRPDNGLEILQNDPRWPLLYYHLNLDEENLVFYLRSFLKDPGLLKDPGTAAYAKRFFSTALRGKPVRIEQVKALETSATPEAGEWLRAIVREAGQPAPAVSGVSTLEDLDLLWADFRATNDLEPLKKIIAVFTDPKTRTDNALLDQAETSLVINGLRNLEVKDLLKTEIGKMGPEEASRLQSIRSVLEALTKLSGTYMTRGYNAKRLEEPDKALKNYRRALRICPDYSIALMNMGTLYSQARGDKKNYYRFQKAALYVDPENCSAAYALGIHFFTRGDHEQAILYYLKALDSKPDQPEYNHAVARAYQEKGDTANAVLYFKRYLELAPHAEHEMLVRSYLSSVQASVPEDPKDLNVMLERGRYDLLEARMSGLMKAKATDENGLSVFRNEIEQLVSPKAMGVPLGDRVKLIEKWVKKKPRSHFANLVAGVLYIDYAWEARGTGYSNTISAKGQRLYIERLEKAQKFLTKAYELDRSDVMAPAYLLVVARGQGLKFAEMEEWYQRAIQADPALYNPYYAKLNYLMPKWYGSREQMFVFARESAKNAPPKTIIPLILAEAHQEMYYRDETKEYFKKDPVAWSETKEVFERVLNDFPSANLHRNQFALDAYRAGDFETARALLRTIGDRWDPGVWNTKQFFNKVRSKVQV